MKPTSVWITIEADWSRNSFPMLPDPFLIWQKGDGGFPKRTTFHRRRCRVCYACYSIHTGHSVYASACFGIHKNEKLWFAFPPLPPGRDFARKGNIASLGKKFWVRPCYSLHNQQTFSVSGGEGLFIIHTLCNLAPPFTPFPYYRTISRIHTIQKSSHK